MITAIVLSQDNAARLHLLLESLHRNSKNLFDITVLYKASSSDFLTGYKIAASRFNGKNRHGHIFPIRWVEMSDSSIAENITTLSEEARALVCLFNDENIMFNTPSSYAKIKNLFDKHDPLALSLRLGNNTIIQNPYSRDRYFAEIPSEGEFVLDQFLLWNASQITPYTNFGIPFSINGNIYRRESLLRIMRESSSFSIEDLESEIQPLFYSNHYSDLTSFLSCPEYSVVIHNSSGKIVDDESTNEGISSADLNDRYLRSKVIDLDYMSFEHISMPFENFALRFH